MKVLLVLFIIFLGLLGAGWLTIKSYPYRTYSEYMKGEKKDKYYELSAYRSNLLKPGPTRPISTYKEDYPQLWRNFQVMNVEIPLPTRNPLFRVIPVLHKTPSKIPQIGLSFQNQGGKEITSLYLLAPTMMRDYLQDEQLFKLPYVRKRLLKMSSEELWKKIFSKEIFIQMKPIDEMLEDLFIHYIRHKFIPQGVVGFGLIDEKSNLAIIELTSKNKDFQVEIVLNYVGGDIFSYVIMTQKNNLDSIRLRSKFVESIHQRAGDPGLARILYTEFKELNFARQIDQEGMLYLFSAWSQDIENQGLYKEIIFYLERGNGNKDVLKNLYQYGFKRYGKTFSTRGGEFVEDEGLNLQRKIELEEADHKKRAGQEIIKPSEPELTPDERMNMYLQKAKETEEAAPSRDKVKVD